MMTRLLSFLIAGCLLISATASFADVPRKKTGPTSILVAPKAPKFTDAERQTELARRRAAVAQAMADKSMLILFSAEPKIYSNSVDFLYRQENNFVYLTGLKQKDATFVMTKNGSTVGEYLFLPKRNPVRETWDGRMYSNEDAMLISGLKTVINAAGQSEFLQAVKARTAFIAKEGGVEIGGEAQTLYLLMPMTDRDQNGMREYLTEHEFSKGVSGYKLENARPIFGALRLIKSPHEIKLMRHAIDITIEALMRSMAMVGRAKMEYEVQAEVEYTFRRRNADYWGYPSIVGCGPNATTLHYVESQGEVKAGDLMLMDVGAEYEHYTADVTRTYPVNGKFTKEQAEIYQIVYDAQEAVARETKPGAVFGVVDNAADVVIKRELAKLGLITAPDATYQVKFQDKIIEMPQFKMWFMHGLGHWLGMNVHDVGDYATPMKPGMIFTNEPGLYFREDALDYLVDTPANKAFLAKVRPVFEKYKNIGVRIEDDMLVTATGVEWMTAKLPRKIADIEAFMAVAPKQLTISANVTGNPVNIFFDHLSASYSARSESSY